MVHLGPLDDERQPVHKLVDHALHSLDVLERVGFVSAMIENNNDLVIREHVDERVAGRFSTLVEEAVRAFPHLELGIHCRWNDVRAGLTIAGRNGLSFMRVAVFADSVVTRSNLRIRADPGRVISARNVLAPDVRLLTDVQVKHAQLVHPRTFASSTQDSVRFGADALIITSSSGDSIPPREVLQQVRDAAQPDNVPILIGCALTTANVARALVDVDGGIVGSNLYDEGHASAGMFAISGSAARSFLDAATSSFDLAPLARVPLQKNDDSS